MQKKHILFSNFKIEIFNFLFYRKKDYSIFIDFYGSFLIWTFSKKSVLFFSVVFEKYLFKNLK